ncbi:hypothetical protein [Cerasicoccus fimbriatus]|uniref:hypothetical protein n=1 Tax=Cerasicoccus fimbriatus TaxID=3014554 RepID=UPI0022B3D040|nr:hypothetical protein [Cerasicoccus sp. TK19100]
MTSKPDIFFRLSLWLAILCGFVRVDAQQNGEPTKVTFNTLAWDSAIKGLYFLDGEKRVNVNIPNGAPSSTYEAPSDTPLIFYRDTGQVDKDGNPIGAALGSVDLSSATKPLLLIFFEQPKAGSTFRIVPIVNEARENTSEIYQLHNISSHDIIAKFNDQNITLKTNKPLTIPAPTVDKPSFGVMMAIQMDAKNSGDWQMVYKAFWPYRKGRSSLVFISDQEGQKDQINVRRFYVPTQEI